MWLPRVRIGGATGQDLAVAVSVFIGTSVDGFIARPNGDLDFLPLGGGEPHGYDEFMANIDALVIGRKTFETVLAYHKRINVCHELVVAIWRQARCDS
jgi:dihydrofolate reductase